MTRSALILQDWGSFVSMFLLTLVVGQVADRFGPPALSKNQTTSEILQFFSVLNEGAFLIVNNLTHS
jgi:hypothetical protein